MVVGFVIRSGLVVGALYYSRVLGVWGNTQQTEKLYNDIKARVSPHVQSLEQKLPFEVPALPQRGEVRFLVRHYYNQGVKGTFHFIQMVPCYAGQLAKKAKDTFENFSKSPEPLKDLPAPAKK